MRNYFKKITSLVVIAVIVVTTFLLVVSPASAHSWPNCKLQDEEYYDGSIGTWVYIDYVGDRSYWYWDGYRWRLSVYHDEWDWHQTGPGYYDGYYQKAHGWYTQPCA